MAWLLGLLIGLAPSPVSRAESGETVNFVFSDIDGRTHRLKDFRGQWLLVNFWAPWCPLCWLEVPALNQLNRRNDFVVLGVSLDYGANLNSVREAASDHQLDFHAIIAGGARRDPQAPYRQVGPVDFFPTSYLYDPSGELAMFLPGQVRLEKVQNFMAAWKGTTSKPGVRLSMDLSRLQATVKRLAGAAGLKAVADWRAQLDSLAGQPAEAQLAGINNYFSQRITLLAAAGGHAQRWSTPGETLARGRGGSEDLAVAKYFSLLALGQPADKLRLVYARAVSGDRMVLAWYAAPNADPLILDPLQTTIQSGQQRFDLRPVYSFNSLGLWGEPAAQSGQQGKLPVWQDLLKRARNEGFE